MCSKWFKHHSKWSEMEPGVKKWLENDWKQSKKKWKNGFNHASIVYIFFSKPGELASPTLDSWRLCPPNPTFKKKEMPKNQRVRTPIRRARGWSQWPSLCHPLPAASHPARWLDNRPWHSQNYSAGRDNWKSRGRKEGGRGRGKDIAGINILFWIGQLLQSLATLEQYSPQEKICHGLCGVKIVFIVVPLPLYRTILIATVILVITAWANTETVIITVLTIIIIIIIVIVLGL